MGLALIKLLRPNPPEAAMVDIRSNIGSAEASVHLQFNLLWKYIFFTGIYFHLFYYSLVKITYMLLRIVCEVELIWWLSIRPMFCVWCKITD